MTQLQKTDSPEIDPENPWADDVLERQSIADYLTPVLASINQPFVIGLHSAYGTGKTIFIRRWRADLRLKGFESVYFNAWETDFSENPLYAFMSALKRQFEEKAPKKKKEKIREQFSVLAKKTGGFARNKALPLILKGLTRKALGNDAVDEFLNDFGASEEEIASLVGEIAGESLRAQEMSENSLDEFKKYLGKIVKERVGKKKDADKRKIIIFVDELDRCRPDYAIEVLESIKHLFSIEGIVFVLAIDDDQLQKSVASVFSPDIDADGYLRRFIDWRFKLPQPPPQRFARFLCDRFSLEETGSFNRRDDFYDIRELARNFGVCAKAFQLSLRQQEQVFTEINLAVRALIVKEAPFSNVLGCLSVIRSRYRNQYISCVEGKGEIEDFIRLLEPEFSDANFKHLYGSWDKFKAVFHSWFLYEETAEKLQKELEKLSEGINQNKKSLIKPPDEYKKINRVEYLEEVIGYFGHTNGRFNLWNESLAGITLKRLEGAAMFADR